jgi:hypothetical protein
MDKLVKEMGETKQLVGELQTQLKQIAAPQSGAQSNTASRARPITEAEIVDATPSPTVSDTLPTESPSAHAAFADNGGPRSENLV